MHITDNLDEMDHILKKHKLPQFIQYKMDISICTKEIELIILEQKNEITRLRWFH